ncbi:MAG: response regulator [Candidatus Methanofastidiosa archaeon]|nr:response regulator [Candidatus Methanofastidiosa archaeon]
MPEKDKILIVEDEEEFASLLEEILVGLGFVVVGKCASEQAALELVKTEKPDLVLMDIMLGGEESGIEIAKSISARYNLPIIYTTAYGNPTIVEKAKKAGAYGYLIKPFRKDYLYSAIEVALYKHRMQNKLIKSGKNYRDVFNGTHDLIQSIKENGSIDLVNPSWLKTLGYTEEELLNLTIWDIISDEKKSYFKEIMSKAILGETLTNIQIIFRKKDGNEIIVEGTLFPRYEEGKITSIEGIFHDMTKHEQMKRILQNQNYILNKRVQELKCLFGISDIVEKTEGPVDLILQKIVDILPYAWQYPDIVSVRLTLNRKEYKTKNFKDTTWKISREIFLRKELAGILEICYIDKRPNINQELFMNEEKHLLNEIAERIGNIVEEKEIKEELKRYTNKLEEEVKRQTRELIQSEKMISLGLLVAGVAHEINNPLAYIKATIDIIKEDLLEMKKNNYKGEISINQLKEIEKSIDTVSEGILRISNITTTLKRFAKPTEEKNIQDITQGLKDTLVILHNKLKDRINIIEDYGNIPKIECNISQLNQVFLNVLLNASESMDTGKIKIKTWNDNNWIYVQIEDNGIGIPPDKKNNIFDPFFTTKEQGTGLGLSVSYQIIKDHKGHINIDSEERKGTKVTISLPINYHEEN